MPSYNSAPYLKEAVESILGQSFHDFELIIVDDGSTDNSPGLLAQYAARDRRIRILRNDVNRGIVFALNRGLEMCRGEYLVRMDADDIAMPDRLERQIAFMDAHPDVAALGASLRYIDAGGQDMNRVRHCAIRKSLSLTAQTPLLHPTVVMRRAVLRQHGLRYQERYRYAEDYYLWLQLSRFGKLAALDDVVI
jgi:glycosyltransferase involved in cell wall biosynthesis